jgi:oxygen-dependent protoporphyrinogen oxidase
MSVRHIVIIGGGVAGLTAAYRLCQKAEREGVPLRLTVVEREKSLGRENQDGARGRLRRGGRS